MALTLAGAEFATRIVPRGALRGAAEEFVQPVTTGPGSVTIEASTLDTLAPGVKVGRP